jgi:beta-lactamase regulating signal transducer with metallopeptidase domain
MHAFWEITASNVLVVTVLAVCVAAVGRVWKNPAGMHFLWLLVLLKLITPPLVTVPLSLPTTQSTSLIEESPRAVSLPVKSAGVTGLPVKFPAGPNAPELTSDPPRGNMLRREENSDRTSVYPSPSPQGSRSKALASQWHPSINVAPPGALRKGIPWMTILAWTWVVGTGLLASVHIFRMLRFRRLLRCARAPSSEIVDTATRIAERLGLPRVPEIAVLPVRLTPLVWSLGCRPRVVLPSALFERLDADAQEAILAHELAHVRRKDHWVRMLELLIATLFWWHPVVWWACRQLRELEEQCCDGLVLSAVSGPKAYATALLDTLDFLSEQSLAVPLMATGAKSPVSLARRIKMLKNHVDARPLTPARLVLLAAVAAVPMAICFAAGEPKAQDGQTLRTEGLTSQHGVNDSASPPEVEVDRSVTERSSVDRQTEGDVSVLGRLVEAVLGDSESPNDRYIVPENNFRDLLTFVRRLERYQPRTLQEDLEHRHRAAAAIRQAAQRIVDLETDKESLAYRRAEEALLRDRIHGLPGATPSEQRFTLAQIEQYVSNAIAAGRTSLAFDIAELTCKTLQEAGQYREAAEANRSFAKLFPELSEDEGGMRREYLRSNARWLEAKAKEFRPVERELPVVAAERTASLDIQPVANRPCDDLSGPGVFEGNGLAELPRGEVTLGGIRFTVGERLIVLGGKDIPKLPKMVAGVQVQRKIMRLYALHAVQFAGPPRLVCDGERIGEFTLHYDDGSSATLPIIFGVHVRNNWNDDRGTPVSEGKVVWTGRNRVSDWMNSSLRLYLGVWENPHQDKTVTTLDFKSTDSDAGPFCVALTVEEAAAE